MPAQAKKKNSNRTLPSGEPAGTRTRFQAFEAQELLRSQIQNAPYNPRRIGAKERDELKKKLRQVGLVETLVWNKRSGNLVSGHQRLSILDDLEGGRDYSLTMAVVDFDDVTEKEINVFLNNQNAMGEWDTEILEALIRSEGVSFQNMGFDALDIQTMFESDDLAPIFSGEKDEAKEDIETIREIARLAKEQKKLIKENSLDDDDTEFFLVMVFADREQLDSFLTHFELPVDMRYLDGTLVAERLGVPLEMKQTKDTREYTAKMKELHEKMKAAKAGVVATDTEEVPNK